MSELRVRSIAGKDDLPVAFPNGIVIGTAAAGGVNHIGTPGQAGFGAGVCPGPLPAGMLPLPGYPDPLSDNYGNYVFSDGSQMVWVPAYYYKWGTGSNGLAINAVDIKALGYFASVAAANAAGYALERAFYDGGAVQPGPYWSFHSRQSISIWVALEDATLENGCLCFLPGSHKLARYDNVFLRDEFGAVFDIYPEMKNIQPVHAVMRAGDCSFHNGLTVHGAGVNMTTGRRMAMSCAYMPDGAVFNGQQNILPDSYFAKLRVGDPLDNDELNPLI